MWTNPEEKENGIDDDGNGYIDDLHGWDFYDDDNSSIKILESKEVFIGTKWLEKNKGTELRFTGTVNAGVISGKFRTFKGIIQAGVSPNAKIMDIRVIGPEGTIQNLHSLIKAIKYAKNKEAYVIYKSTCLIQRNARKRGLYCQQV